MAALVIDLFATVEVDEQYREDPVVEGQLLQLGLDLLAAADVASQRGGGLLDLDQSPVTAAGQDSPTIATDRFRCSVSGPTVNPRSAS